MKATLVKSALPSANPFFSSSSWLSLLSHPKPCLNLPFSFFFEHKNKSMAAHQSDPSFFTVVPVIYILFIYHLSLLSLSNCHSNSNSNSNSIQDLLKSKGLPAGLFPRNVKSYDLDEEGHLQVYLEQACMAKFETRVFFDSVVRANLSYGGLIGVEGLSQEELFLWLPVKDIIVYDPSSGLILFDIGVAYKQLSLSLFEDPPVCHPQGELLEKEGRKEGVGISS